MKTQEIMYRNEKKTAIVIYSQFDLGNKYKIYTIRNGVKKYAYSYDSLITAIKYCNMIP